MIAKCLLRQRTNKTFIFDYKIPQGLTVVKFQLVEVPFASKKVEAIVLDISQNSKFANRDIIRLLTAGPIITQNQLELANQIAFEFFNRF